MKQVLVLLIALAMLGIGCAAAQEEISPLCGAVLVSQSMGGDWSLLEERRHLDAVLNGLDEEWLEIAMAVPDERIVDIRGGQELYLVLPLDADATVSVVHLREDGDTMIAHSESGEPFLLRCNAIESPWEQDPYLPDTAEVKEPYDCLVIIEDSVGNLLVWNPYVHFYRGEMNTQDGGVIDFTDGE